MKNIKVGILISYDYKYAFDCISIIYEYVDEIILAVDINKKTWSGNTFEIDETFFESISKIDNLNKITIYKDNFYNPDNTSMENETMERNMISKKMGNNCWQLQIDCDEYFLNFEKVFKFLNDNSFLLTNPSSNPILLKGKWITLFKKTEKGFLYIDNDEFFSFGTNLKESYSFARNVECKTFHSNFYALHQSWARDEDEILQKIKNWGHKTDFDVDSFFRFWMTVNESNYTEIKNFHPVYPEEWKELKYIEAKSIDGFINIYKKLHKEKLEQTNKFSSKYFIKHIKNKLKFWK